MSGDSVRNECAASASAGGAASARAVPPKFVYLYSNPLIHGEEESFLDLDLSSEIGAVHRALTDSGKRVQWMQSRAVKDRLCDVTTLGCTLLHWAGHGHATALVAEDEWGRLNELLPEVLQEMCQRGVSVAIITSCFSEFAGRAFVQAGIPHVVAVRGSDKVSSYACQKFTYGFYLALLCHHTVSEAFEIGKAKVRASYRRSEADRFILLPEVHPLGAAAVSIPSTTTSSKHPDQWALVRPGGSGAAEEPGIESASSAAGGSQHAEVPVFPWEVPTVFPPSPGMGRDLVPASHHCVQCLGELEDGAWVDISQRVEHMHPFPPSILIPRKQYTFKVVNHFASRHGSRVVVLTGPPGVGKYTVAQWTCEWLKWEVTFFPGGLFWIDCSDHAFHAIAERLNNVDTDQRKVTTAVHSIFRSAIPPLNHRNSMFEGSPVQDSSTTNHPGIPMDDDPAQFQRDLRACQESRFLIVLARWDALPMTLVPIVQRIVAQFMDHTRHVKFLVTCQNRGHGDVDGVDSPISQPYRTLKTVPVKPLDSLESATLLYRLLPHEISMEEINACAKDPSVFGVDESGGAASGAESALICNAGGTSSPAFSFKDSSTLEPQRALPRDKIIALAKHRAIAMLQGSAKQIVEFVGQVSEHRSFADVLRTYDETIRLRAAAAAKARKLQVSNVDVADEGIDFDGGSENDSTALDGGSSPEHLGTGIVYENVPRLPASTSLANPQHEKGSHGLHTVHPDALRQVFEILHPEIPDNQQQHVPRTVENTTRHESDEQGGLEPFERVRDVLERQLRWHVGRGLGMLLDDSDWLRITELLNDRTPIPARRDLNAVNNRTQSQRCEDSAWLSFCSLWELRLAKQWHALSEIRCALDAYCNISAVVDAGDEPASGTPVVLVPLHYFFSSGKRLTQALRRRKPGTFAFRCSSSNPSAIVVMWTQAKAAPDQPRQSRSGIVVDVRQFHLRFINGFSKSVDVATSDGPQTFESLVDFLRSADYLVSPLIASGSSSSATSSNRSPSRAEQAVPNNAEHDVGGAQNEISLQRKSSLSKHASFGPM